MFESAFVAAFATPLHGLRSAQIRAALDAIAPSVEALRYAARNEGYTEGYEDGRNDTYDRYVRGEGL